jgi:hypothetical protein
VNHLRPGHQRSLENGDWRAVRHLKHAAISADYSHGVRRFHTSALFLILALLITAGCSNSPIPVTQTPTRSYSGTASVGDFLDITIDTAALTIPYANLSNGDAGVIPYTVNSDGTYALNDPAGNLIAFYEIPGYAMLVEAEKAGPDHARRRRW